jgi:hypothetical protein
MAPSSPHNSRPRPRSSNRRRLDVT